MVDCPTLPMGISLTNEYPMIRQYGSRSALITLFIINLLNFADRYIPSSVKPLFQADLHMSDFETSLPSTGMILVYMIFAVIFGILVDKEIIDRRFILCGGIILWSAATSLAGLANSIVALVTIRSLVGIGEAAYGTIAPPMLSDFYPEYERNIVYGIYYLAVPLGGALGFAIGSIIGGSYGWRIAFLVCGAPGIIAALWTLRLNNPIRGINDPTPIEEEFNCISKSYERNDTVDGSYPSHPRNIHEENDGYNYEKNNNPPPHKKSGASSSHHHHQPTFCMNMRILCYEVYELLTNKPYMCANLGLAANNFCLGGLADWYGTYMIRYTSATIALAGIILGLATVVGGILGTIIGSKVADGLKKRMKNAYFFVPATFAMIGTVLLLIAVNITESLTISCVLIILIQICVWTYTAPISAISINTVPPRLRARSAGLQILIQHALGDIIAPPIIGGLSDHFHSLKLALQCTWIALAVSSAIWYMGYFFLAPLSDQEPDGKFVKKEDSSKNIHESTSRLSLINRKKSVSGRDIEKQQIHATTTDDMDINNENRTDDIMSDNSTHRILQAEDTTIVQKPTSSSSDIGTEDDLTKRRSNSQQQQQKTPTYLSILCGQDPLIVDPVNGKIVLRTQL